MQLSIDWVTLAPPPVQVSWGGKGATELGSKLTKAKVRYNNGIL